MNKIKSFWILLLTVISCTTQTDNVLNAQPGGSWQDHLKLEASVKMEENCEATLQITATLNKGWHIFSLYHDPEKAEFIGSPTVITISKNQNIELIGKPKESKKYKEHKDELGIQLYHEKSVVFSQRVKILNSNPFDVIGDIEFQICDENGCIFPPAQEFTFKIKPTGDCELTDAGIVPVIEAKTDTTLDSNSKEEVLKQVKFDEGERDTKKKTLWTIFILGFAGGLVALLTPCVFPLIPMTVSFFTKQSKSRRAGVIKALSYGGAIVFIYVLLGGILSQFMSGFMLNDLSSNIWLNLIFFAIFILFAFSFLGAFELRMPSGLVNKADRQADKGGLIGVFFMAFTLVLVSFSCTGPIVGTLLIQSMSTGAIASPVVGMLGFGLALALPFTLFAIFPSWLSSLPQSGGWLNSVKVVLGLLELAIAMKFLSTVDLAYGWGIVTRELFIAVWVITFAIIGLYLLGKIRFAHDDKVEKLSVTRFMFGFLALTFTMYLVPGMWGAPLHMIEGVAPPRDHSEDGFRFVNGGAITFEGEGATAAIYKEYASKMHAIQDGSIKVFHDLDEGFEFARKVNLPVLLDFTGYACENCRRTESKIWLDKTILPTLQKEFVIISLYVDEKTLLPEEEQYYSEDSKGKIKTVGNKWADYQIKTYKQMSQPLYVVVDAADSSDLTAPRGYDPSVEGYEAFLMKGLNRYHERRK
jgi:thiol:disulfide interchange protein DsbD